MKRFILLLCLPLAAHAQVRPATPEEVAAIEQGMRNRLKDPDSMKMENVRVAPGSLPTMRTVCGEVNAKNGFGGYTGMRTFYGSLILREGKPPAGIVIGVDNGRGNAASSMCAKEGL